MTWDADDIYTCPICGDENCVPPKGPTKAKILIIGDEPGKDEVTSGKPFSGPTEGVLRSELARLGVDLNSARLCNMWLHPKKIINKKDKEALEKEQRCFEHSLNVVMKEAKGKQLILLMGAQTVKYFCGENVSDVSGLKVTASLLSAPIIMASIQPTTVFHGTVGEFRFAMTKFAEEAKRLK